MSDKATLRDELTEIRGVGDAKADEMLDILDAHDGVDGGADVEAASEHVKSALEYAESGDVEYAVKFLRRARDAL